MELQSMYRKLYIDIYGSSNNRINFDISSDINIPHDTFFQSWLLRGDDPLLYQLDYKSNPSEISHTTYWERCGLNNNALRRLENEYEDAHQNEQARWLYYRYHFDNTVRIKGNLTQEYKLPNGYDVLISKIQQMLLCDLAAKHLSIESNPTSNILIGGYKQYNKHPIKKFFNLGLTYNQDEIDSCPQISVSINTDDLGVFPTSIDNEYALMAASIEKEVSKKENTSHSQMIYDWLDRIRIAGMEQRFNKEID